MSRKPAAGCQVEDARESLALRELCHGVHAPISRQDYAHLGCLQAKEFLQQGLKTLALLPAKCLGQSTAKIDNGEQNCREDEHLCSCQSPQRGEIHGRHHRRERLCQPAGHECFQISVRISKKSFHASSKHEVTKFLIKVQIYSLAQPTEFGKAAFSPTLLLEKLVVLHEREHANCLAPGMHQQFVHP